MLGWKLFYTQEAINDLKKLNPKFRDRVKNKLNWLVDNFNKVTPLSLGGKWSGFFKLRIGDWRIIYDVDWKIKNILVEVIDKRDKIYK